MSLPLLQSKLFIAPTRPTLVPRARLIDRLNEGVQRSLTLVSAPAGFGKTTLVSDWVAKSERAVAWLSLDEEDSDPARFLTYLVASLQSVHENVGADAARMLQGAQTPPITTILSVLLNELAATPTPFTLVLDDYHVIQASAIDEALAFMVAHLPPHGHLVMITRADPSLPLSRLRVRGQLTEIRAADLRFTSTEAAAFLYQEMGLHLPAEQIEALERRTEGWIAGLQLAALAMRGQKDTAGFINAFSGSHRFVLDYLVEEVLEQQPEHVRKFLLRTAILNRLCGELCDAVVQDASVTGQLILETLERANLFLVPLDGGQRWYRYHHLFADLLRQQLQQRMARGEESEGSAEYHRRASQWYEENGMDLDAFHHAAAAQDVERATRLMNGEGMPLHYRGAATPVLNWLSSLPTTILDATPSLWVTYASALTMVGKPVTLIEEKLRGAEAALHASPSDDHTQDLTGQIAAIRAMLAVPQNQIETIIEQAHRALELLHRDNLSIRTTATWAMAYAYQVQGNRAAARRAYADVMSSSQASGNTVFNIAAATGLGQLQEADNELYQATESYNRVLQLAGDPPLPVASAAYLGLTRISYEWNDLNAAEQYGQKALQLGQLLENSDVSATVRLLLARLKLAGDEVEDAVALLAQAEQIVRRNNFMHRMSDIVTAQVSVLLRQRNPLAATALAEKHDLPLSMARVHLAQGEPSRALALLETVRRKTETKGGQDEQLAVMVLEALAYHAAGNIEKAVQLLGEVLALAAPGGFIRTFVDEGTPMMQLLSEAAARGVMPDYTRKLLTAFPSAPPVPMNKTFPSPNNDLIEPLSDRELEVLTFLADGLTNPEIASRLYLSLHTVKVHTRNIYSKLNVHNRTQAAASGRALGLLPAL